MMPDTHQPPPMGNNPNVWFSPEIGSSEDIVSMMGPPPVPPANKPPNGTTKTTSGKTAIPSPPTQPISDVETPRTPTAPVAPPQQQAMPQPRMVTVVVNQPGKPTLPTSPPPAPFPPAPTPPPAPAPAVSVTIPSFPATPQADVPPAEAQAEAQAQLPYIMSSMTQKAEVQVAPKGVRMSGGRVTTNQVAAPGWIAGLVELVVKVGVIVGVIVGLYVTRSMWVPMIAPGLSSLISLTQTETTTSWPVVIPVGLLIIGAVFVVLGYQMQRAAER